MKDINDIIYTNQQYDLMCSEVKKVRDCVSGSFFVKYEGTTYLAHPSDVDQTSKEAISRYTRYKQNASFVEIPGQTLNSVVGKLKLSDSTFELPESLDYLTNDVDKDGLTLTGLVENCASEQIQVNYSILVSDYQGLTDVDTSELSVADIDAINPRATINQYTRENILDWSFERVNGRMQLTYVLLRECTQDFDYNASFSDDNNKDDVISYLKLALDEEGYYYQQKMVSGADSKGLDEGERNYPLINGSRLMFLPAEIVADKEFSCCDMPIELGYLVGICELTLERYNNDADYKEVMRNLKATTYVTGADNNFAEQFPVSNNGRTYISVGGVNVLNGADVAVQVVSADDHTQAFERYKTQNEKEIRALGGVFPSDELRQRTATETVVEAANMTAVLNPMVSALEIGIERAIGYCAMFEGLVAPDDVEQWSADNIMIELPREFASQKMTVEERKQLHAEYTSGAITRDTYLNILEVGGVIPDAEEELSNLELEPPRLTATVDSNIIEGEN